MRSVYRGTVPSTEGKLLQACRGYLVWFPGAYAVRGIAFVEFTDADSAKKAIDLSGKVVCGRPCVVGVSFELKGKVKLPHIQVGYRCILEVLYGLAIGFLLDQCSKPYAGREGCTGRDHCKHDSLLVLFVLYTRNHVHHHLLALD